MPILRFEHGGVIGGRRIGAATAGVRRRVYDYAAASVGKISGVAAKQRFFSARRFEHGENRRKTAWRLSAVLVVFDARSKPLDGEIGEHWYRTETYTTIIDGKPVTETRTVQETEWWNLEGQHHNYYSGYLVSGSRGLPQSYAEQIKPFRLEAIKRYQPYFLAGWLSEEYSVDRDTALPLCQQEFQRWEQRNIERFLPGDTSRNVLVDCEFSDANSDLILLPVYLLSYRYGDKLFRFLLNGQTGKTAGDKPNSPMRIGAAVVTAIVLIVILWFLFAWKH